MTNNKAIKSFFIIELFLVFFVFYSLRLKKSIITYSLFFFNIYFFVPLYSDPVSDFEKDQSLEETRMSISDKIEDLFKDNYDALCVFSMHYVGDIYTAEDVVMDSFLKLSEKIKDGEEIIAKKHYLYQIVRNESIDVAHYKSIKTEIDDSAIHSEDIDDWSELSEREAKLWKAIDSLPQIRREVLLMSKRDGMKNVEIASSLNISVRTVESHLYKAYRALRGKAHEIYVMIFF